MNGSIICGVDDSEPAKGAARTARGLSAKLGLPLIFVRVVERTTDHEAIGTAAQRLEGLTQRGTAVDAGAAWRVEVGHPADQLVAVAAAERASLIVVGSHGSRSSLLGSVSADVSRRAPCPVVVVPPGAATRLVDEQRPTAAEDVARFGVGPSDDESATAMAGGITRFNLGTRAS